MPVTGYYILTRDRLVDKDSPGEHIAELFERTRRSLGLQGQRGNSITRSPPAD